MRHLPVDWARAVGFTLVAAGVLALLSGARGAGGQAALADRVAFAASGVLGGLALVQVGLVMVLGSRWRRERDRLGEMEAAMRGEGIASRDKG